MRALLAALVTEFEAHGVALPFEKLAGTRYRLFGAAGALGGSSSGASSSAALPEGLELTLAVENGALVAYGSGGGGGEGTGVDLLDLVEQRLGGAG